MGWKWTLQGPTSVHIYDKILWESNYQPHFYKICHGMMLPLYQVIFYERPPRFSREYLDDLTTIEKWFGAESFTYVRIYVSLYSPHVLPLCVPDKLLSREVAYQTLVNDLTKSLKEAKKIYLAIFSYSMWSFYFRSFKASNA